MIEQLERETEALEDLVFTLKKLDKTSQARVLGHVNDVFFGGSSGAACRCAPRKDARAPHSPPTPAGGDASSSRPTRVAPRMPRGKALLETVELARQKGTIENRDVAARWGMTPSGADQRIQAALRANLLRRVSHGVYEAVPETELAAAS